MTDRFAPGPDYHDDHTGAEVWMKFDRTKRRWHVYYRVRTDAPVWIDGQSFPGGDEGGEAAQRYATKRFRELVSDEVMRVERPGQSLEPRET